MARFEHGDVKVDDSRWRKLLATVKGLDRAHVDVGVLASKGGNAKTEDGQLTMVELMAIHELGSPSRHIPAREPIRKTFDGAAWLPAFTAKLTAKVVDGSMSVERALSILGQKGVAEIKKTITTGPGLPPPLKPATIARKGSTRPLVDTGRLLASISYNVITGGFEVG